MHRFYLPTATGPAAELCLTGREAHHALHVLRLRRGETVTVLDGAGRELRCTVLEPGRDQVRLSLLEAKTHPALPCRVTLLQGLPKGKTIETIIQKATELGAARVVPLLTERSVPQFDPGEAAAKAAKWQAVAIEAIKQCGSPWLPQIEAPIRLHDYLRRADPLDLSLLASLQDQRRHPRDCFQAFRTRAGRAPQSVGAWVGPEGDFSPAELEAIQAAGAQPISLGPLVLRADTAALCCLAILGYELHAG